MRLIDRRVKIVATIGPATQSVENLEKAILAGMNVARLNFSHGQHEVHREVIKNLRVLSKKLEAPVAILQDLQGPKIRVGRFKQGSIQIKAGEKVTVTCRDVLGEPGLIPSDLKELASSVKVGDRILLDDGLLELKVLGVSGLDVSAEVIFGGELKDRKGMNLPGIDLPIDGLTPKDLRDLEFGLEQKVDYVALSFVRRGSDISRLREIVDQGSPGTKIVAKIEMLEALEHLEDIISLSDAVMVARGDLAIEAGQVHLPRLQKLIIETANRLHRPVITATQMLDSMVENPRPTRAEITDVANAVLDGSDALMLSAESASGLYPAECIRTMHDIIIEVEKSPSLYNHLSLDGEFSEVPESIAASSVLSASMTKAAAIVCLTSTGKTATLISSFRPEAKIFAVTDSVETLNRLELSWGIQTFAIRPYKSAEEAMSQVEGFLLKYGLIGKGDHVVFTLGSPVQAKAKTNALKIHRVTMETSKSADKDLPLRCRSFGV